MYYKSYPEKYLFEILDSYSLRLFKKCFRKYYNRKQNSVPEYNTDTILEVLAYIKMYSIYNIINKGASYDNFTYYNITENGIRGLKEDRKAAFTIYFDKSYTYSTDFVFLFYHYLDCLSENLRILPKTLELFEPVYLKHIIN